MSQINYLFTENKLNISGKEIQLPFDAMGILEYQELLIVLLTYHKSTNRNIHAYDVSGQKIWEVQEAPNWSYSEKPYTSISIDHDFLIADNWLGVKYAVDPSDGSVSPYETGHRPW